MGTGWCQLEFMLADYTEGRGQLSPCSSLICVPPSFRVKAVPRYSFRMSGRTTLAAYTEVVEMRMDHRGGERRLRNH